MAEDKSKKKSWWERLQHTYRLVVMNNETFEEVGSYRLTLLNVYIVLSMLMVVVAVIVVSLIVLTPIKRYIPGYGDVRAQPEIIQLNRDIDSMAMMLQAQRTYTESFRKMLLGEADTLQVASEATYDAADSSLFVDRIEEDEILRREVEMEDIREIAQLVRSSDFSGQEVPLEQLYFSPPLTGEISAGFMPDKKHFGVDVLAPKNTPVMAVMDGWVIMADWTLETGNTIGIQHDHGIISFYKHNSVLLKSIGSYVKAGEAVAIIGNTGTLSDGPHLHFELWQKGRPVDPTEYVNLN